jgi:hypothetical protein
MDLQRLLDSFDAPGRQLQPPVVVCPDVPRPLMAILRSGAHLAIAEGLAIIFVAAAVNGGGCGRPALSGRRGVIRASLVCAALLLVLGAALSPSWDGSGSDGECDAAQLSRQAGLEGGARFFLAAAVQALWLYTLEVVPTCSRGREAGFIVAAFRLLALMGLAQGVMGPGKGGLGPLQDHGSLRSLASSGGSGVTAGVLGFAALCAVLACLASAWGLPLDTRKTQLRDRHEDTFADVPLEEAARSPLEDSLRALVGLCCARHHPAQAVRLGGPSAVSLGAAGAATSMSDVEGTGTGAAAPVGRRYGKGRGGGGGVASDSWMTRQASTVYAGAPMQGYSAPAYYDPSAGSAGAGTGNGYGPVPRGIKLIPPPPKGGPVIRDNSKYGYEMSPASPSSASASATAPAAPGSPKLLYGDGSLSSLSPTAALGPAAASSSIQRGFGGGPASASGAGAPPPISKSKMRKADAGESVTAGLLSGPDASPPPTPGGGTWLGRAFGLTPGSGAGYVPPGAAVYAADDEDDDNSSSGVAANKAALDTWGSAESYDAAPEAAATWHAEIAAAEAARDVEGAVALADRVDAASSAAGLDGDAGSASRLHEEATRLRLMARAWDADTKAAAAARAKAAAKAAGQPFL